MDFESLKAKDSNSSERQIQALAFGGELGNETMGTLWIKYNDK